MIWFLVYALLAVAATATIASVDADFEWTESHPHMAASLIIAALWPMALVYLMAYRAKRDAIERRQQKPEEGK